MDITSNLDQVVADVHARCLRVLDAGLHIVTERSFGAAPTGRERLLRGLLAAADPRADPLDVALGPALSVHADSPLEGTCVHAPVIGYGTRSSSLVRVDACGQVSWWYADGPPCTAPYAAVDAWQACWTSAWTG